MEKSRFSGAIQSAMVKSGTKNSGSSRPEIEATSTFNKFTINGRAVKEMGLNPGGSDENAYIVFFDLPNEAESQEDRYFVCKGWPKVDEDGNKITNDDGEAQYEGAKIGTNKGFTYSIVYGTILFGDLDATEVNKEDLYDAGVAVKNERNNFVATKKVQMQVVETEEGEAQVVYTLPDGTPVERTVFALRNFRLVDHEPKSGEVTEEDVIDEGEEEDDQ